jgi:tripartite-type tricarboxylate transporter receptor subunit TctC
MQGPRFAVAETLPNFESSAWFGFFAPAKMPADVARSWSDAARAAVQSPDVRRRIEAEGATVVGNNPQEFSRFVVVDIARWREVVKFSGAKPE